MTSIYLPTQPFNYAIDYDRNEDEQLYRVGNPNGGIVVNTLEEAHALCDKLKMDYNTIFKYDEEYDEEEEEEEEEEEVDEDIKTSIYLPTEIFTKIMGYCGESYEEKRDRLWRSIQPKIGDEVIIIYDKTKGASFEWYLTYLHPFDIEEEIIMMKALTNRLYSSS